MNQRANWRQRDATENTKFGARIRKHRLASGLTIPQATDAADVTYTSWRRWEQGLGVPRPWRLADLARSLGIPVAQLLTDELVLAELRISAETLEQVRVGGPDAAAEVAERIARSLEPLLLAAATAPKVDVSPGARPKRRRSRREVVAGVKAARAGRARVA